MLCQDCNEREATIHLTQITGNKKTVLDLCRECAQKRGFDNPLKNVSFPLADFLASMAEKICAGGSTALQQVKCPGCGLTFVDFSKSGRVGCGKCYEAFRPQLDELLRKIHGSNRHTGKLPTGSSEMMETLKEQRKLKDRLREAVQNEDDELAAEIRDRLREEVTEDH